MQTNSFVTMINRVLIRIKVVQLLYSYLLTEKLFTLESQPTPPTKEKRFAYQLYLDMLALMVRLAGAVEQRGGHRPLEDNRFIRMVREDEKIRSLIVKQNMEQSPFASPQLLDQIAAAVKESSVYKAYVKQGSVDMSGDLKVWREIFSIFLMRSEALGAIFSQQPNFSLRGVERMRGLMEVTFVNFSSSQDHVADALKTLNFSLGKARELYCRMLQLAVELTRRQDLNLDAARHKYVVTDRDLNPNLRFVENGFVRALAEDPDFVALQDERKGSLTAENPILINALLKTVTTSEVYRDYMDAPDTDFRNDCEFWRNLYRFVIFPDPDLSEALEDKSVFWNDDLDIIGTFVLKTIRRYEDGSQHPIMPMYKDDEDARFGRELFNAVVKHKDEYRALVAAVLNKDSWDADRLAFMDVVILLTALAELMNFPKIPVNVTINEYIELAKAYSTPKSAFFINGILGAAVSHLRDEGKLIKA